MKMSNYVITVLDLLLWQSLNEDMKIRNQTGFFYFLFFFILKARSIYMQVPRYLLFCEGGGCNAHALTLVGTKLSLYIGKHCKCCFKIYFVHFATS